MDLTLIDRADALPSALAAVDAPVVGLDVERADGDRYFRRAALIQLGVAGRAVLIDTVALDPVPGLSAFLAGRTVVLHAMENDLAPLRSAGVEVDGLQDTAVAAALLGLPTGLDPLLQELLGVALSPDKERFQRANWERRPLPDDMAAYAAGDVVHLPALWDELARRLEDTGRRAWYDEEIAHVRARSFDEGRDWSRTKGAGRMSPEQRAVLRALWEEREAIAREFDIAPNRVLRVGTLRDLAKQPAADAGTLIRRNQRRGRPSRAHGERLFAAQERGRQGPPEGRSSTGRRVTPALRDAYDAMRQARARTAEELGIDAGVLCPSRALWGPIREEPASPQHLCELAGLRAWQTQLLAEDLWAAYTTALAEAEEDGGEEE